MAKKGVANWTDSENASVVACYLSMLKRELAGQPINKAAENKSLRKVLKDRTKGAVEYKLQNVSAVLLEYGWLFIDGYKPARNIQGKLRDEVIRQLSEDKELDALMASRAEALAKAGAERAESSETAPAEVPVIDPPDIPYGEVK
jgi:hypothetical protein